MNYFLAFVDLKVTARHSCTCTLFAQNKWIIMQCLFFTCCSTSWHGQYQYAARWQSVAHLIALHVNDGTWCMYIYFVILLMAYCKNMYISWASNFCDLSRITIKCTHIFGIAHHYKCNCRDLICNWKITKLRFSKKIMFHSSHINQNNLFGLSLFCLFVTLYLLSTLAVWHTAVLSRMTSS